MKKHTIFFSKIVVSGGLDLCSAGVPAGFLEKIVKMIARLLGKLSLCVVIIEDCGSCEVRGRMELADMGVDTILAMLYPIIYRQRTILRADIISLSILSGGIVGIPENVKHVLKGGLRLVKDHVDDLDEQIDGQEIWHASIQGGTAFDIQKKTVTAARECRAYLSVTGATGADGPVTGVGDHATSIPDTGSMHARRGPELTLCTPEAVSGLKSDRERSWSERRLIGTCEQQA